MLRKYNVVKWCIIWKCLQRVSNPKQAKWGEAYTHHREVPPSSPTVPTETAEPNAIRKITETESDAIIVASFGTFSTGINIPSLENVIFASPSKSKIRNLQSIGRGLRLKNGKTECNLYDLADDLSWKSWKNHTLHHFAERLKTYSEEKFNYKIVEVKLWTNSMFT